MSSTRLAFYPSNDQTQCTQTSFAHVFEYDKCTVCKHDRMMIWVCVHVCGCQHAITSCVLTPFLTCTCFFFLHGWRFSTPPTCTCICLLLLTKDGVYWSRSGIAPSISTINDAVKLGIGLLIAIIVGSIAVCVCICVGIYYCMRKPKAYPINQQPTLSHVVVTQPYVHHQQQQQQQQQQQPMPVGGAAHGNYTRMEN